MSRLSTDPIADMLTRIRNAVAVNRSEITLPHSGIKEAVAKLLKESNFVNDVRVEDATVGKSLVIVISDTRQGARISEIVRLSTPGRRHYATVEEIPVVKQGRGLVIISTSKGVMTGQQAKSANIGGELICKVY
ncbi:MAG TPA: 30S ribosomal protein S8 [Candidatus Saccharimonadales bacterium]|nr:30S ribosomal protein S8 [Candidatus Saccharimonadales bacterium]